MNKYLILIMVTIIEGVSTSALASNFKCISKSENPELIRYEIEFSFDPVGFRIDSFLREEDGSWTLETETLADATGVLKPVRILWSACKVQLSSNPVNINYEWSKGTQAAGHLVLDTKLGAGEFYSSLQMSGTVYRHIQFSDCAPVNSH